MNGSRIIYAEDTKGINVEFRNSSTIPYVVQGWFDSGDENSTPENGIAPFTASPGLFRIKPKNGQIMRVVFTGNAKELPNDKESVFYFNFLQIPPSNIDEGMNNKILVVMKNRVKVFYRPKGISDLSNENLKNTTLKIESIAKGVEVTIENRSAYHLSIIGVTVYDGKNELKRETKMISPFSEQKIIFYGIRKNNKNIISIDYINDQGARLRKEYARFS